MGGLILETISAQIMTLPFILYIFKSSSLIALFANVLVVPLIPLAMLLSFISGLAGMYLAAFSGWLALPAKYLLTYLIDMPVLLSRIPNMQYSASLSLGSMLFVYAIFMALVVIFWHKQNGDGKITDTGDK